jgi:hypothetical protein
MHILKVDFLYSVERIIIVLLTIKFNKILPDKYSISIIKLSLL